MNKPVKYTIELANDSLKSKNLAHFLSVSSIDFTRNLVTILDMDYGSYCVDLKSLSPKTQFPLHKMRKHKEKFDAEKIKYVSKELNGYVIMDVFYGPDRGYKNRSFYFEYKGICGHLGINTKAFILKNKKPLQCRACSKTTHGARALLDGQRKDRTPTYNAWVSLKESLPEKYHDFYAFRLATGDKPYKKATVKIVNGRPEWVNLRISEDDETNLIAIAIRQAFRHSELYKNCLRKAQIETEPGTRYRCAICGLLFKRTQVQVDHIDPITNLDGSPLKREGLIERIFTNKIQILDKSCHVKKSSAENKLRRTNKNNRL